MLSASHNAMPDNGIKFFARGGHKLADDIEDAIEARLGEPWERPTGAGVGRVRAAAPTAPSATWRTCSRCCRTVSTACTWWSTPPTAPRARVAPTAFEQAGARVSVIGCEPDGLNINDGYGSTHLENLQRAVVEHGADLGIALDGDADRCLAVDATGADVDGDQIMAVLSLAMRERGRAGQGHPGGHRDEQPRHAAGSASARASRSCRRRSATATCWRR